MSEPSLTRELEVAERLARAAGALILPHHGKIEVDRKDHNEPVTQADRDASELILEGLTKAFPDDRLVSEEEPDGHSTGGGDGRVWYVDPLDGTKDFIRGDHGFSVMIGLVVQGRPRLGVVYQVTLDRLYAAAPGVARVRTAGTTQPLQCSTNRDVTSIRLVASKSHRDSTLDRVKRALAIRDEVSVGSVGVKMGLLACGERDLYVNTYSRIKLWDSCAPEAILVAAGGRVTDLQGGPLRYDGDDMFNLHGIVASNSHLHESVLERLKPLF